MDNYNRYIIDLVLQSRIDSANGSTGSSSVEEPSANLQSSSDGSGWTIDKTYADLQALQAKGTLTSLAWHREDGTVVTVPLTSTGPVDGKDAFVFSTIITTADGSTFNAFILDEDDVLTYVTEDIGGGGGGGGVDTAFKVVGLKDGHPNVTSPSKKIIYLTKEAGSTARDPYTEWIYTEDSQWQVIGETSVDLTDYAKKEDLNGYAKTSDLDSYATKAELSNYALQSAVDGKIDKVDPHGVSGVIPSFTPTGDLMSSGLNVSDVATKEYCSRAYKSKQTAVPDPTASGNAISFISTITQDTNGVMTATKANLPQASTTAAGIVQLGSGATNAATGNHTHTTEIASDSGSPTVNLEADTTYKLTAGGTSVVFKTPSAGASADEKVKATAKTDNVAYPLMAVASSSPTSGDATEAVYGASVTLNPSTNTIAANISGDAATASDVKAGSTLATTIGGKANKVTGATDGELAMLDSSGDLKKSDISFDGTTTTKFLSKKGTFEDVSVDVSGKADKVSNATEGDIATLDSNGNLTDSGVSTSDFATSAQGTKADSAIQGVSAGGTPLTPDANKVVNIPNAVATGESGATDGLMTADDKKKLNGIASGAEINTIESISVNGVPQTPDANRNVDLTIIATGGVQGVKLDGAQSPLTPDASDIVTIPNAVSADSQNATNGLMTASDKQKLDSISSNNLVPTTTGIIDQVLTTNSSGTVVWSSDVFVTKMFPEHEVVIGNVIYKTVIMPDGSEWMTENLDYKFTGCDISYPISPILGNPTTPTAWYYNNNESYSRTGFKCGLLYNWYAVKLLEQNKQDLLPPGWHVPTLAEMQSMVNSVGANAGTKLKATSVQWTEYWDGTDQYEFNFTPTGYYSSGEFKYMGRTDDVGPTGYNWSITDSQDSSILKASALYITYGSPNVMYYTNTANKEWAMGLRLVKYA